MKKTCESCSKLIYCSDYSYVYSFYDAEPGEYVCNQYKRKRKIDKEVDATRQGSVDGESRLIEIF